jgi:hypothetical protein
MTNQNQITFTFNSITFDVKSTGNAKTDYQVGGTMSLAYLKTLRENYNESNPLPPKKPQLANIVSMLDKAALIDVKNGFLDALDIFLQPVSYASRIELDNIDATVLIADIESPTAD